MGLGRHDITMSPLTEGVRVNQGSGMSETYRAYVLLPQAVLEQHLCQRHCSSSAIASGAWPARSRPHAVRSPNHDVRRGPTACPHPHARCPG